MVILSLLFALGGLMTTVAAGSSSFGGVNHYFLASLDPTTRDQVIDFAVAGGAKVIRTFVRPETNGMEKGDSKNTWPDVESPMGKFVNPLASILDNYDDMLYSIYKSNSGNTKVILSLHDANMLPPNPFTQPCDAYCTYMKENNMPWQSFYTDGTIRNAFKTRLNNILNNYPSKNFGGRPWSQLSEIILSIDLENEPGVANPTYPLGGWICDIASYLKNNVGLQGIGVSTGGIGGSDSGDVPPATSGQNWPDEVFTCAAIDIISLHGYYKESGSSSAGQPWCDLLSPNGVLVPKALNNGKLLMAEEWVYNGGPGSKNGDIQTQAHALNALGIPWSYWDIMSGSETCSTCGNNEVSVDDSSNGAAFFTLSNMMYEASITTTVFDWSRFFPTNPNAKPITDGTCGPGPSPSPPGQPGCKWGCLGWDCSATSPCAGDLQCTNGVCGACTWGCLGWDCFASSPCQLVNQCVSGVCKACNWGCPGWKCSASQSCQGDGECDNGTCGPCTWGCLGWQCSASSPCKGDNECVSGVCKPCSWGCPGWQCSASSPCKSDHTCTNGVCVAAAASNLQVLLSDGSLQHARGPN